MQLPLVPPTTEVAVCPQPDTGHHRGQIRSAELITLLTSALNEQMFYYEHDKSFNCEVENCSKIMQTNHIFFVNCARKITRPDPQSSDELNFTISAVIFSMVHSIVAINHWIS